MAVRVLFMTMAILQGFAAFATPTVTDVVAKQWYPWGLVPEPHRYGGPSVSFWVSGEKTHPKSDFQTQQKRSRKAGSTVIVTLQGGDGGICRQCTFQQSLGSFP